MDKYGLSNIETTDIDKLNAEAIMALLMWVVRGERFCDGLILSHLKEGRIQALLQRLKTIDSVEENKKRIRVVAAVILDDNRVFATARGYGEFKGQWEFPGGKIEAGESPQDALKREIHEELEALIQVGDLIDTIEYDYPSFHLSMDCFWAKVESGELVLKEAEAAKWLTVDELDSVQWLPADLTLIEKIRKTMQDAAEK